MSFQTPTVGRIVHFAPRAEDFAKAGNSQPYPAVITHVFNEMCVNLSVFNDGSFPLHASALNPTSVSMGTGTGTWAWPTRA